MTARRMDVPLSLCGEAASDALGAFLMIGLGVRALSCAPSAIPELKKLVRSIEIEHAERLAAEALEAETGAGVRSTLVEGLEGVIDLSELATTGSLSRPE
jgi:signal transduction protein with GAF and PtsI domain